jgi:hypothetical protein
MTKEELLALVELLNRTPMTQAEKLWLQSVLNRELAKLEQAAKVAAVEN